MTQPTSSEHRTGTPFIPRRKPLTSTIGIFGVGHHTYWPQFEGLFDELKRKLAVFVSTVRSHGDTIVEFGIVDEARSAYEREFVLRKLEENRWNMTKAAAALGLERSHLYRKMRSLGIAPSKAS